MRYKSFYDLKTGYEVKGWESPKEPGVFHQPANSTDVKPPDYNAETQSITFRDGAWAVSNNVIDNSSNPEPEVTWYEKRCAEYGGFEQQIEFITENGLEAWQTKVAEIKKKYPKS